MRGAAASPGWWASSWRVVGYSPVCGAEPLTIRFRAGGRQLLPLRRHDATGIKFIANSCAAIFDAQLVGRYAVHFKFGDAHDTGIFRWDTLRKLEPTEVDRWGPPETSTKG